MTLLLNMYQVILNSVRLLSRSAANGLANNEKPFSLFLNSLILHSTLMKVSSKHLKILTCKLLIMFLIWQNKPDCFFLIGFERDPISNEMTENV